MSEWIIGGITALQNHSLTLAPRCSLRNHARQLHGTGDGDGSAKQ